MGSIEGAKLEGYICSITGIGTFSVLKEHQKSLYSAIDPPVGPPQTYQPAVMFIMLTLSTGLSRAHESFIKMIILSIKKKMQKEAKNVQLGSRLESTAARLDKELELN